MGSYFWIMSQDTFHFAHFGMHFILVIIFLLLFDAMPEHCFDIFNHNSEMDAKLGWLKILMQERMVQWIVR